MIRTCFYMLFLGVLAVGLFAGCDSGSGSSDGPYSSYIFISDTDQRLQIYRDGGTEWKNSESFQLTDRGDEHTVELEEEGDIKYGYAVLDRGDVTTETIGNQIFFR
ncbi:MAG: hypothetical protein PHP44_10320 [Kiritimatiellae bacterium]|nr:hypothetical protein [Kiritimatiellia bacterium]MDD4736484.1 hypothetical protein [Kiritimatiellia bacterium]